MSCPKYFDYLNDKHLIELFASKPNQKLTDEFKQKCIDFGRSLGDFLQSYCEKLKLTINNNKIYVFVYDDIELKIQSVYISISREYQRDFVVDAIKVLAFK